MQIASPTISDPHSTPPATSSTSVTVVNPRDERPPALSLRARRRLEALIDALPRQLDVWLRSDAPRRGWSLVERTPQIDASHADRSGPDAPYDASLLLRDLPLGNEPVVVSVDGTRDAVVVPLHSFCDAPSDGSQALAAVVALFSKDASLFGEKLARLAMQRSEQDETIAQLKSESRLFAQQVNDDFEELSFLRRIAGHLELSGASQHPQHVVSHTLSAIYKLIDAQYLGYVEIDADGELQIDPSQALPQGREAAEIVLAVTKAAFRPQVEPRLIVRNNLVDDNSFLPMDGVRQLIVAPVNAGTRRFGWFVAVNRLANKPDRRSSPLLQLSENEFGTWEASLLSSAAAIVAAHASNLELLAQKEELLIHAVRSFVSAIDAKDSYTRGHSDRVAMYAKCVAHHLGYDAQATDKLYLSGLLHDVGKIGVSDSTLNKPGALTPEEFREIQKHPDEGWAILHDLEQLRYVLPGVLHHHERFDGKGYPDGLVGEAIPLDARILAVVDAYDAMTSNRAYRQNMPHERAVSILRDGAGTQWDPVVVDHFLSVVDEILTIRTLYVPPTRSPRLGPELHSIG